MPAAGTRLRIASYNLENLDDRPGTLPPFERRVAALRPLLTRLEADLLCLQEVNGRKPEGGGPRGLPALDRVLDGTPYARFHRAASTSIHPAHGAADRHNLVILSRFPLSEVRQIRHDLLPPPHHRAATADPPAAAAAPVTWERPALAAAAELPDGRRLHLIDLHLRAPLAAAVPGGKAADGAWRAVAPWAEGFFLATVKRVGQATEARLAVDRLFDADPDALICVAGDCNAEEREMPLRVLRADVADTGNPQLAGRSLESLDHRIPAGRRYSLRLGGRRLMLDHLLASPRLAAACTNVEVWNAGLPDETEALVRDSPPAESFHAPLLADFVL